MLKKKLTQVIAVATIAAGFVVVGCGDDTDPGDVSTPGDPDRAKPKTTETKEGDGEIGATVGERHAKGLARGGMSGPQPRPARAPRQRPITARAPAPAPPAAPAPAAVHGLVQGAEGERLGEVERVVQK